MWSSIHTTLVCAHLLIRYRVCSAPLPGMQASRKYAWSVCGEKCIQKEKKFLIFFAFFTQEHTVAKLARRFSHAMQILNHYHYSFL